MHLSSKWSISINPGHQSFCSEYRHRKILKAISYSRPSFSTTQTPHINTLLPQHGMKIQIQRMFLHSPRPCLIWKSIKNVLTHWRARWEAVHQTLWSSSIITANGWRTKSGKSRNSLRMVNVNLFRGTNKSADESWHHLVRSKVKAAL